MSINKIFLIIIFSLSAYNYSQEKIIISDDLEIIKLTENVFIHISYLETQSFGRVPCNGVIYINDNEAVFLDTPLDTIITSQLLKWFEENYSDIKINGVVVNHFHDDCLGGLEEFHKRGIKSYSHELTPELAEKNGAVIPLITFEEQLEIKVG
ncbi:MAG TPA: hypothetical protein VLN45_06425, partial [Ignavibacteriaceae bacterium]|nr:hypothetical protein [Ignavibacteriaceae bacterium]